MKTTTNNNSIKLYFANLNAYNNGILQGKWYDLEDYTDVESLMEDVEKEVCNGSFNYNEYAIHDYEAPFKVSEYTGSQEIEAMINFCNLDEYARIKAAYLYDNNNYSELQDCIDNIDAVSFYQGMTLEDVAEELVQEGCFGDIPESIRNYIDYEAIARDLGFDGYNETSEGVFFVC